MDKNKKKSVNAKGREFWGPPIWFTIHVLASMLKPKNGNVYRLFLECLECLLPCTVCCGNLTKKLKKFPPEIYMLCNHDAFFYSYCLHDMVNSDKNIKNQKESKNSKTRTNFKNRDNIHNSSSKSPNYDSIKSFYFRGASQDCIENTDLSIKLPIEGDKFWLPSMWFTIHTLSCTLKSENAQKYKTFLRCISLLIPDRYSENFINILEKFPPDAYLTNNHDAFFYSYCLHDIFNEIDGSASSNFDDIKTFYFRGLSQECKDCNV
jgi:hypothetical protein